jgi:hypothetical protein
MDLSAVDATYVVTILNGVSAIAVVLGVIFVVLQLKQNNRLIEASNKQVEANFLQARSSILLSLVERLTDDMFAFKRKAVRDIVKKYQPLNWEGFLESTDDYTIRAFASFYEYTAFLAKRGIVELETLLEMLGHRISFDWEAIYPAAEYYRKAWGLKFLWVNYEWMAQEAKVYLEKRERELSEKK